MINYFNFKKLNNAYLITNDLGRYMFADSEQLKSLVLDQVDYESDFGKSAQEKMFCYNGSKQAFTDALIPYYRESKNYLFEATGLHIFVVTNACNMACLYCQAQNGKSIPTGMMTEDTAKKAVDIALSSPAKRLSFEFQGGEPLMNFSTIRYIVLYTQEQLKNIDKQVDFNIVTNLTLLTDEIIDFVCKHNIGISTSVDGNEELHNLNRKYRNGAGTFSDVVSSVKKLREREISFGAIQTTTRYSLNHVKEIIDTYVEMGFPSVFIRNLSPLGCAAKQWNDIGYSPEDYVAFYKKCLEYIIKLNETGIKIAEGHATIMLSKIFTGHPVNYMELRSPCGAAVGQIAYYYDGNVYTCDEGRMLAEMGDNAFCLGTVDNTYDELMNSSVCKSACIASCLESLPNCQTCVYNPYCGTCPVIHYASSKDIYSKVPGDYRCSIYQGMFDAVFELLKNNNYSEILSAWI